MLTASSLDLQSAAPEINAAREQLHPDQPQRVIAAAAHTLSQLSSYVGHHQYAAQRKPVFATSSFLRLGDRRVLVIIVFARW